MEPQLVTAFGNQRILGQGLSDMVDRTVHFFTQMGHRALSFLGGVQVSVFLTTL